MLSKNLKIIIILTVLVIFAFFSYNFIRLRTDLSLLTFQIGNSETNTVNKDIKPKDRKKRFVFFDLGTNNGDSVKFFVDKVVRSDKDSFLKGYGALDNKKWEIYAVEANPYFNKVLADVKVYCEKLGHEFHLYTETAAWTKNEKLVFFLDTINFHGNFWGSSLLNYHPDVVNSGFKNVTVTGIDVADLLRQYDKNDEVVMKIDIEGTEYPLLLHLIKEHLLDRVDIIATEFHSGIVKNIPTKELETFFSGYFRFMDIRTVPWY